MEQNEKNAKSQCWTYTLNNYDQEPGPSYPIPDSMCLYHIFTKETCPTTGTPHLQGYVEFKVRKALLPTLKRINKKIRWAVAKGTAQANYDYIVGENGLQEPTYTFGTPLPDKVERMARGSERSQEMWTSYLEHARNGEFDKIPSQIYIRYRKAFREERIAAISVRIYTTTSDDLNIKNMFIYGPTGTGKSLTPRMLISPDELYIKSPDKWWDEYNGEPYIIIDDIKPGALTDHQWKTWLDIYPFKAEYKGGYLTIRPRAFIITSNYTPFNVFGDRSDESSLFACMQRRLNFFELRTVEHKHTITNFITSWLDEPSSENVHTDAAAVTSESA